MNSKIILCKDIKLDRNYVNVLNYTEQKMLELCQANQIATRNNYSFIRPTNSIFVDFTYDQCIQANYIAFQNPDYSNKWFFAWVDEVIYKSDKNCEITYTIDAWSTWFDKWTTKTCFVNRHHVNNDTIGANTINENLDVGEVIQENEIFESSYSEFFWVGVLTSHNPTNNKNFPEPITVYKKNVMSKKLCLFNASDMSNLVNLGLFLLHTTANGHTDDIDTIFYIPDSAINQSQLQQNTGTVEGQNYIFYTTSNTFTIEEFNTTISKLHAFSDYTPKNNKCFVYPYNYLFVSNNIGNHNIYKYEDFSTNDVVFKNQLTISVGMSGRIVPLNYKGMASNEDETIPLAKYPTIAWSSDSYINWLTQQAINVPTQIVGLTTGALTTDYTDISAVGSLAGNIGKFIGQFYTASLLPNVTHGQNTADINFLAERNTFTYRQMRAKTEYLRIIDDYFTKFGYAIKRLTLPNITGRRYWNYIEIGQDDCIGYGSVPSNFMDTINKTCRRGTTVWHNHANIGDYSLNNTIV